MVAHETYILTITITKYSTYRAHRIFYHELSFLIRSYIFSLIKISKFILATKKYRLRVAQIKTIKLKP